MLRLGFSTALLITSASAWSVLNKSASSPLMTEQSHLTTRRRIWTGTPLMIAAVVSVVATSPVQAVGGPPLDIPHPPTKTAERTGAPRNSALVTNIAESVAEQRKSSPKLQRIVRLQTALNELLIAVKASTTATGSTNDSSGDAATTWSDVQRLVQLHGIPTRESDFKALFDAYSDPLSYQQRYVNNNAFLVYYTKGFDGPGRPSIESTLPTKQPMQSGARNDAWVAWSNFLTEYDYLVRLSNTSDSFDDTASMNDLMLPLQDALVAIDTYLAVSREE